MTLSGEMKVLLISYDRKVIEKVVSGCVYHVFTAIPVSCCLVPLTICSMQLISDEAGIEASG
jgi:hypothetical protein